MKRLFLLYLLVPLLSCSKGIFDDAEKPVLHLNICVLGNSYSNDAYSYVPFILRNFGITTNVHIYYRGSGSLHDLDEQWEDDDPYGIADLDGGRHMRLYFSIDTRGQDHWQKRGPRSAREIVASEKWDIISLQQGGRRARVEESYYPYLENVMDKIARECAYPYQLAWFMAYNAGNDNYNQESVDMQRRIVEEFSFPMVFPVATAVFSAQEHPVLSELGDSEFKRMYASDNVHLQEGLPCYLAALTIAQAILNQYLPGRSVLEDRNRPTQSWIRDRGGITPNGESTGVTDENCIVARRIAVKANEQPFQIQHEP